MIAEVQSLLLSTVNPQPRPQKEPRKLSSHEYEKTQEQAHWDEGAIVTFQQQSDVHAYAIDLYGGGTLILFTTKYNPDIAIQTDALLRWLGTPKGFTVNLWWRDDPRHIGATEWPSRRTVNGGWTYPNSTSIVIYRSEEWDRVLIHEVIHAMGWDWKMPSVPLPCWAMKATDSLQPALLEAWTELYAEWLWCGWHGIPWNEQRKWQEHQAVQILARRIHEPWHEDTNVFAYYILKAALAPHITFVWCFGNGTNAEESSAVLCGLVTPELERLRRIAATTTPTAMSLRMTIKK